jgi:hypothetical protein
VKKKKGDAERGKESGPRGPGFDFTPEGWNLLLDIHHSTAFVYGIASLL